MPAEGQTGETSMRRGVLARRWGAPVVALLLVAGSLGPARPVAAQSGDGVATITGSVTVSNPYLLEVGVDPFVLLTDLTAFVQRDRNLPLPSATRQVTAGIEGNVVTGASFSLALPIA